jgi:hypothetical protein
MIPTEVENRVAKYFFHRYLPEEVMMKIVDRLLTACVWDKEEDLVILMTLSVGQLRL